MLEVLDAVSQVWGRSRRPAHLAAQQLQRHDRQRPGRPRHLAGQRLNDCKLAYLHLMRGDFFGKQQGDVLTPVRANYKGVLVGNMGYTPAEAEAAPLPTASSTPSPSAPPSSPTPTCRRASDYPAMVA
jgi:N-ethylmaleimide reductase